MSVFIAATLKLSTRLPSNFCVAAPRSNGEPNKVASLLCVKLKFTTADGRLWGTESDIISHFWSFSVSPSCMDAILRYSTFWEYEASGPPYVMLSKYPIRNSASHFERTGCTVMQNNRGSRGSP